MFSVLQAATKLLVADELPGGHITFWCGDMEVMRLNSDGTITLKAEPDEAAKAFIVEVKKWWPWVEHLERREYWRNYYRKLLERAASYVSHRVNHQISLVHSYGATIGDTDFLRKDIRLVEDIRRGLEKKTANGEGEK
jgi:hypothetical protein